MVHYGFEMTMRKRIILLGATLMAMASPLYADISNPDAISGDGSPASFRLQIGLRPVSQIANLLLADTQSFLILDTRSPSNAATDAATEVSGVAPASAMSGSLAPVPEPTHYALMGLGFIGLYLARRDRLKAK